MTLRILLDIPYSVSLRLIKKVGSNYPQDLSRSAVKIDTNLTKKNSYTFKLVSPDPIIVTAISKVFEF